MKKQIGQALAMHLAASAITQENHHEIKEEIKHDFKIIYHKSVLGNHYTSSKSSLHDPKARKARKDRKRKKKHSKRYNKTR